MQTFSWEEIKKHTTTDSYWIVAHGKIYDVTSYLKLHPPIMTNQNRKKKDPFGQDVSISYDFHGKKQKAIWKQFFIGKVESKNAGFKCIIL